MDLMDLTTFLMDLTMYLMDLTTKFDGFDHIICHCRWFSRRVGSSRRINFKKKINFSVIFLIPRHQGALLAAQEKASQIIKNNSADNEGKGGSKSELESAQGRIKQMEAKMHRQMHFLANFWPISLAFAGIFADFWPKFAAIETYYALHDSLCRIKMQVLILR
jgi:hypothetical protein